jgi:hypothetical protein
MTGRNKHHLPCFPVNQVYVSVKIIACHPTSVSGAGDMPKPAAVISLSSQLDLTCSKIDNA